MGLVFTQLEQTVALSAHKNQGIPFTQIEELIPILENGE
jgi:hypothetical protein